MTTFRRVPLIHALPPAEVLTLPLVRSEAAIARYAEFWGLDTGEVKSCLFVRALIADGRIGKGDRE